MTPDAMRADVEQIHTILLSFKLALKKAEKDGVKTLEIANVQATQEYVKDGVTRCLNLLDALTQLRKALE